MKQYISYAVCFMLLLWGCKSNPKDQQDGYNHATEQHAHDGHNHDDHDHSSCDGHDHEGHNHAEDGHNHDDHEGCTGDHDHDHDHDHDGHSHGSSDHEHSGDEIIFTKEQAKAVGLKVKAIELGSFNQIIKTGGRIEAAQGDEVTLVASLSGVVSYAKTGIVEGHAVRAGESIVTISAQNVADGDPILKARYAYETAKNDFERAKSLVKDTLISRKEFEQVQLTYETARVAYEALSKNQTAKGISIVSPINGYIKSRLVSEGEYVSVGQPIAVISQNKRLQLKAEVTERYYKYLSTISSANFRTPYDTTLHKLSDLKGRMLSYGKSSAGASFYVPVIFEFDNIGQVIPGSFVEVYLISSPISNVITVPLSAVIEEQGLYFVYLQVAAEEYKRQEVVLGENNGRDVHILSGLQVGDRVVIRGAYQVKMAATASVIPEGHGHNH